jgi:hypothetical protein
MLFSTVKQKQTGFDELRQVACSERRQEIWIIHGG